MDWFKTKTPVVPTSNSPEHLLASVRTMEDDLSGRKMPSEISLPAEPLVAFHPDVTEGAPFYAASGAVAVETEKNQKISPFLQEAEPQESVPQVEAPMFDPPLPAPPDTLPVAPLEGEVAAVPFTTTAQSTLSSLKRSLGSLSNFKQSLRSLFRDHKLQVVTLAAIILLLIALGVGIRFWMLYSGDATNDKPDVQVESPELPGVALPTAPVSQTKYQADQPNILSFDTETVTSEQIKNVFLQAGQTIQKENLPGAVEFLVRDQKYNPLALSRFAYLANLSLPAELLGTLDESFSIYLFTDNGRPRLALLAYVKDQPAFEAELRKNEKKLAPAMEVLFLDVTTAPKNNLSFRDGAYLDRPVRFANIDSALGLSIDYAVRGRQWIIGTSKDSLRAVLDKTGL